MKGMWVTMILCFGFQISLSAQHGEAGPSETQVATCDTTYIGPPDGPLQRAANWTMGVPQAGWLGCFPPEATELAETWVGPKRILEATALNPSPFEGEGLGEGSAQQRGPMPPGPPPPPPPTTPGVCCLGATCIEGGDYFDCLLQGGYFLENTIDCSFDPCALGVCCTGDPPVCRDDNGGGGRMDPDLCDILGGNYLGGAECDNTDACARFRIPSKYEIVEFIGQQDVEVYLPRTNNCAEIVFSYDSFTSPSGEVMLYDNGIVTNVTGNNLPDGIPDINDTGAIVWGQNDNGTFGDLILLDRGKTQVLGNGEGPSVSAVGHVGWNLASPQECVASAYKSDVYLYNGVTTHIAASDGLSNQSVHINDPGQLTWTAYRFPCDGASWTSQTMFYNGTSVALPSSTENPQLPDIDNQPRVAWGDFRLLEVWTAGVTSILADGHGPSLNDRGDVAYAFKTDFTPWQVILFRDGSFSRITSDFDIDDAIHNIRPAVNNLAEIAWQRHPNGASHPSGIVLMRRIRNGDVNFDGIVDLLDAIPLPGCWTGPGEFDGLCECRFYDIDHDRDVDDEDLALFMRVYTGPQGDCNGNGTMDLRDLIDATSADCNFNGSPDQCDLSSGSSVDSDNDGMLDECCVPAPVTTDTVGTKNRFLTIIGTFPSALVTPPDGFTYIRHGPNPPSALRVTFVNAPPPFDGFNGTSMWVTAPREVCENAGQGTETPPSDCGPAPGLFDKTFWAATLTCDPAQAYYTDWSTYDRVHLYHEAIIPGGSYRVQTILQGCGTATASNYSAGLTIGTPGRWGDLTGTCATNPCTPPNGVVDVNDVLASLDKFAGREKAVWKARADLFPAFVNFKIDVADVVQVLNAFGGAGYPWSPFTAPCP